MENDKTQNRLPKWLGREFLHKEVTESTNDDVRTLAVAGSIEGTLVTAECQTAGKGRRGRIWQAEEGKSLLFSILLRPRIQAESAPQITLLMAMAVTKTLRELCGLNAKIKWPNDVVVNAKKVSGILTEMGLANGGIDYVIVGTGVNVNEENIPEELQSSATSLLLECGSKFVKEDILNCILYEFENYYEVFLQTGNLENIQKDYNNWLVSLDKEVKVLDPKGEYCGISRGINKKGELLVELETHTIVEVYAGEVSVRGLYGYV